MNHALAVRRRVVVKDALVNPIRFHPTDNVRAQGFRTVKMMPAMKIPDIAISISLIATR